MSKTVDEVVAQNVSARLFASGLSQKELAEIIGTSPIHLNKLLKGERRISKSDVLKKIAEAFNCDEVDLFRPLEEGLVSFFKDSISFRSASRSRRKLRHPIEAASGSVPEEVIQAWPKVRPWQRSVALFFLTGEKEHLKGLRKDLRENLLAALRFHQIHLTDKAPRK